MQKKTRPVKHSEDSIILLGAAGILLIALGLMVLLAVVFRLPYDLFIGLQHLCFGLAGTGAYLLSPMLLWGGILVMISIRRKPAVKPFVLSVTALFILLTLINLLSRNGSVALPVYFERENQSVGMDKQDYFGILTHSYEKCSTWKSCGGLIGSILSYPLFVLAGDVFPAIVLILLLITDLIFLLKIDLKKVFSQLRWSLSSRPASNGSDRLQSTRRQQAQQQRNLAYQQQRAVSRTASQPVPVQYPQSQPDFPQAQPQAGGSFWQQLPDGTWQQVPATMFAQPQQGYQVQDYNSRMNTMPLQEPVQQPFQQNPQDPPLPAASRASKAGKKKKDEPVITSTPVKKPVKRSLFSAPEAEEETEPAAVRSPYAPPMQPPAAEIPAQAPVGMPESSRAAAPVKPAPARASRRSQAASRMQEKMPLKDMDTPPWEEAAEAQEPEGYIDPAPFQVTAPKLQTVPPKGQWKPEIKLPSNHREQPAAEDITSDLPPYVFPDTSLLADPVAQEGISQEEDNERVFRLQETMKSFRIPAQVVSVTHGPAISRYEMEIASGIKVQKIMELNKNIAMNMEVKTVRIEAPIPGKRLVGVEIPNKSVTPVTFKEVLLSKEMVDKKGVYIALGRDIAGTPIAANLVKMPHLLIAGATGSGKSVCINAIINSLIYRHSPQEVRLIMIDPKVVELQVYNGIPHLMLPVVSNPLKASNALNWAVEEMERRYHCFEEKNVRSIEGYNNTLEPDEAPMPRIVIIIDELADLMMVCKHDVEQSICRLTQLARASGIHLIVATQRPSVNVITGLIKANIPTRISFKVTSNVDSRTILDRIGAEQLIGYGDMLYLENGADAPVRVQGCFLKDEEVMRITDQLRADNPEYTYDPNIIERLQEMDSDSSTAPKSADIETAAEPSGDGSLLQQCIEMAVLDGQVSTSVIQRRLKLGYSRAGRLVDEMEKRGIVGPKDGSKPRLCLISREQYEMMKESGELEE